MRPELTVATSEPYDDLLSTLVTDRVASRLAAQDATLWGPKAEPDASIRLSWVGLPRSSRSLLTELDALRAQLWSEDIDRVVLCGMGGSSLAPEVISRSYGVPLEILDSTNPSVVSRALSGDLARTVVVVSSKSGGTVETDSQRRAFEAAFLAAGIDAASRFVVVTDPGSDLERLATEAGYRKVFTADPDVGGRYSALTAFGLVPSALAGVDIADLLDEAEDEMDRLARDSPDNVALLLAAAIVGNPGRDKLVIADAGSGIVGFGDWAEQLIAESTGKQGLGVLPVAVEGVDAPEISREAPDVVVALLTGEDTAGADTTKEDAPGVDVGAKPVVSVSGTLGAQFLLWETATAIAGRIIGINPFDQPDVESAKKAARGLLDEQPETDHATLTEAGIEVRGSQGLLDNVDSLSTAVDNLLAKLGDDGYLAVMAYLDSQRDSTLAALRATLSRRTNRPVTFGWGPRFLHSTGQYHKGGPGQGVFLQITCDETRDIDIPERAFGFGTLIAAQAAGDAKVLADHDRPVLRLHLLEPESGVDALQKLLA
ncbi:MAG: glucose-6-phosphate isomerase [Nocardioidaceae bacterium]|nr:glucose-6-phosphate isomerase [Nocardioidaceae bacterium]